MYRESLRKTAMTKFKSNMNSINSQNISSYQKSGKKLEYKNLKFNASLMLGSFTKNGKCKSVQIKV